MSRFVFLSFAALLCLALGPAPAQVAQSPVAAEEAPALSGQGPSADTAHGSAQRLAQNPAPGAKESSCAPANVACRCSFQCCGEERCDGSICSQCVIDCVQRQQAVDRRSQALRARCQSLMTRGFKRL
jgi:hypothetical protein